MEDRALGILEKVLAGSDRPLVIISGKALVRAGHLATKAKEAPKSRPE